MVTPDRSHSLKNSKSLWLYSSTLRATTHCLNRASACGGARPHENVGPNSVKPFSGSRSFPSGHATTVFAFTTPWIFYYPGIASGALFTLGLGTAVARMADQYHWFSDVLGGAFIGFGVGYLLSRRHQRLSRVPSLNLSVNGFSLTWRL